MIRASCVGAFNLRWRTGDRQSRYQGKHSTGGRVSVETRDLTQLWPLQGTERDEASLRQRPALSGGNNPAVRLPLSPRLGRRRRASRVTNPAKQLPAYDIRFLDKPALRAYATQTGLSNARGGHSE